MANCLNGSDKPAQIELADGTTATMAKFDCISMRTVECADGGETVMGEAATAANFVKVQVNEIAVKEKRFDSESGFYSDIKIKMNKQKGNFNQLNVEFNGQTFDLLTTEGKLQFIFAKSVAALPVQAMMSIRYKSPMGGQWYVDKQPIDLDLGVSGTKASGCCVVM